MDGSGFGQCTGCVYRYCTPGMTVSCVCAGGMHLGTTTCLPDGSGYDVCGMCNTTACNPGESVPCTCDNGSAGTAPCLSDGSGYGACTGCMVTMAWYCTDMMSGGGETCLCSDDSQVGNNVTCGQIGCCFSGTVANSNPPYHDCDCYASWEMSCDANIAALQMGGTYTNVSRVSSCPQ
jgi:hypothetical protein